MITTFGSNKSAIVLWKHVPLNEAIIRDTLNRNFSVYTPDHAFD